MSDYQRSPVSYDKEIRARAKRDGKGLACMDVIDKDGARKTYWGPASEEEQKLVARLILKIIRSHAPVKTNLGKPKRKRA